MIPFNTIMNRLDDLSESKSFFKSQVITRALILTACLPLETLCVAQNLIKLPFEAAQATIKIPAKVLNVIVRSTTLSDFEKRLAGPLKLVTTALKVVGYSLGIFFTALLGMCSPHRLFQIHAALELVEDVKAATKRLKEEEAAAKQKEIEKTLLQMHVKNLVLAQRLKIAEEERMTAQQALQVNKSQVKDAVAAEVVKTESQSDTKEMEKVANASIVAENATPAKKPFKFRLFKPKAVVVG